MSFRSNYEAVAFAEEAAQVVALRSIAQQVAEAPGSGDIDGGRIRAGGVRPT